MSNPAKIAKEIMDKIDSNKYDYASIARDLYRERPVVINTVLSLLRSYPDFLNYFAEYAGNKSERKFEITNDKKKEEVGKMKEKKELYSIVKELKRRGKFRIASSLVKVVSQWETLPKGWTWKSLDKFSRSLTKRTKTRHKGFVSECVKKMRGKVSDPYAFCASLKDKFLSKRPGGKMTTWRTGRKYKRR